ncbi:MAG TPA: hypothetical protein VMY88_01580 [Acidimicrobiales bacterium]|nr:hypothetical protein [Acidimicrobiales bacterium]
MTETQDILFGVTGQSLVFDAPEGRATGTPVVSVFENEAGDDTTAEVATTGAAAVETNPNTTLDASAAALQQTIPLTATTGCTRGRRFRVTNATGEWEDVEVKQVTSGDSVVVRLPLQNAYASADTFVSTRIAIAVDSTWVADRNNISDSLDPNPRYRVRWQYVVSSVTYVRYTYCDLVRAAGQYDVNGLDVDRAFPGWLENLPTYDREDQGANLIKEAFRQVKLDFYAQKKADQMARNIEVVNDLVLHRAVVQGEMAKVIAGGGSPEAVKQARELYQARLLGLIAFPKIPFATDSGGAGTKVAGAPMWRR